VSEFVLHPQAYNDIAEIWDFIASDNVDAADGVIQSIYEALSSLARFPQQGHKRPDLTTRGLRFQTVGEYLIAYVPDKRPLVAIAVVHGRRSPRVLAAILRRRG